MSRSLYAQLHQRYSPTDLRLSRREALAAALATSAGLLISCTGAPRVDRQAKRVVVVGAGFGGLACAYELSCAGYDVVVVEARKRVGGRVLSLNARNGNEFASGRNVEGGAELIGANHPTWQRYARQFRLRLLDVTESATPGPIVLKGRALTEDEGRRLYKGMEAVLADITRDAVHVNAERPWTGDGAASFDQRSVADRLASISGDPLAVYAAGVQMSADNAVGVNEQSYLGMLACIRGGGLEKYWTESETHRCEGGNQRLAFALAREVGDSRLLLGTPVAEIDTASARCTVTLADGSLLECDEVVVATPPSVWANMRFRPELPTGLRPQMGLATKYLASVRSRFWEKDGRSPDAFSDEVVNETWEGTDGQRGEGVPVMVGFSGGPSAARLLEHVKPGSVAAAAMEQLYPGFTDAQLKDAFMDWPRERWTAAGYSFPAPGQVMRDGPILHAGLGRLHFAGEHTCYQFCGYMEGGLYSGASVARRMAERDGLVRLKATAAL